MCVDIDFSFFNLWAIFGYMHLKSFSPSIFTWTSVWRNAISFFIYLGISVSVSKAIFMEDKTRQKIRWTDHLSKIDKQLGEWLENKSSNLSLTFSLPRVYLSCELCRTSTMNGCWLNIWYVHLKQYTFTPFLLTKEQEDSLPRGVQSFDGLLFVAPARRVFVFACSTTTRHGALHMSWDDMPQSLAHLGVLCSRYSDIHWRNRWWKIRMQN